MCLRRFAEMRNLKQHKARVHEGKTSKDFECRKCHKRFTTRSDLNRHNKTVHLKLREHVCEVCGRAFGQNVDLQAHIRKSHTFVDDEDDEEDEDEDEARSDDHGDDDNADDSDSESSSLEELLRKRLASRNKRRRPDE